MAEGTVRTSDGEDQARYLRSLDDRIAALERETIVIPDVVFPEVEIPEPCCVCDSFAAIADNLWTPATGIIPLVVDWEQGAPVIGATTITPGLDGAWQVNARIVFTADSPDVRITGNFGTCWQQRSLGTAAAVNIGGTERVGIAGSGLIRITQGGVDTISFFVSIDGTAGLTLSDVSIDGHFHCALPVSPFCVG